MEYIDEQYIADQAEQMLGRALQNHTKTFEEHYSRKEGAVSLKDAHAKASTKKYGRKRDGNQKIFLRSLAIKMARHGFVQHYGVDTIRAGAERKREKPRSISYFYEAHQFKMREKPFISDAIQQSGVVDFVSTKIAELRGKEYAEELVFNLSRFAVSD